MAGTAHVIVFPLPAQGHINPLSCLADYLVSSGLTVTLVHTSRSFSLLSRSVHDDASSSRNNPRIEVIPDAMPALDTQRLSRDYILASFPLMEQGLDALLQKLVHEQHCPPSCIVTDSFLPWTRKLAQKYGIPRIEVWTTSAALYCIGMQIPELIAKGYLPMQSGSEGKVIDFIPGLPSFPISAFPKGFATAEITSPGFQFFTSVYANGKGGDRILINPFYDLESTVIDALRAQQVRIDPIGPLLPCVFQEPTKTRASLLKEDRTCLDWLDAQEDCSVLYVSFGSVHAVEKEVIHELALGLEASQERFLWVIRPDMAKGNLVDLLPDGFQTRIEGTSRIISWAPQLDVLEHPAVGAFLTHCGWNSTIESLYMGVPMIGFPRGAEQNTNLHWIIDWKVGMALEEQSQDGSTCSRESVERAVRSMMRDEEGKGLRSKARELKEVARNAILHGNSKTNLESLVCDLKQGRVRVENS